MPGLSFYFSSFNTIRPSIDILIVIANSQSLFEAMLANAFLLYFVSRFVLKAFTSNQVSAKLHSLQPNNDTKVKQCKFKLRICAHLWNKVHACLSWQHEAYLYIQVCWSPATIKPWLFYSQLDFMFPLSKSEFRSLIVCTVNYGLVFVVACPSNVSPSLRKGDCKFDPFYSEFFIEVWTNHKF